jgi:hypothetical protein
MKIISFFLKAFLGSAKKKTLISKNTSKQKIDVLIKRAEDTAQSINGYLNIANESKNITVRQKELNNALEKLVKLKEMAIQYPFLKLDNLYLVETNIAGIENETNAMLLGQNDNDLAIACIATNFRIINESIDIARKSKNNETKISRLQVATESLNNALIQARKFSIDVDGFNQAEAEIIRISKAMSEGTPTEIEGMLQININDPFASESRNLLKEATNLKKEKKYIEACAKLQEAYLASGAENLMIEDRLRLPMYLQLAGKNNDGWDELNRLLANYTDECSNPKIMYQMKIFLKKEKNLDATNPIRVAINIKIGGERNLYANMWKGNDDITKALEFSATLQLRTPLRVLLRNGEVHSNLNTNPPEIAQEIWEGIWIPQIKTWSEMGINMDEMPESTMASDIGDVKEEDYLPFLITVRKIVESNESIEDRIRMLREYPMIGEWLTCVESHDGIDNIIDELFPRFIKTIPKINHAEASGLISLGLITPNLIAAARDGAILGIKGIGKEKVKALREYCNAVYSNRDNERIENITR